MAPSDPSAATPTPDALPRCGTPSRDYGEFLTSRGRSGAGFYLRAIFMLVVGLFGAALLVFAFFAPPPRNATGTSSGVPMFIVGSIMLAAAAHECFKLLYSYDFYEQGLIRAGPRRTEEFAYEEIERFKYSLVRHYHNGVYTGTLMTLKLWMEDGRKFSYGGKHKERRKGFIKRHFEGEDEMDIVREAIEIHVAERIEEELDQTGAFDWCKAATVSRAGVTPAGGKRKGTLVAWAELREIWMNNGHLHLAARGDKKSFVAIPSAGVNFFPCMRVFGRLAEEARGQSIPKREEPNDQKTSGSWSA
ncbi:MAG: hypothetical protein JSS51_15320 [Planctomycetes bacterium]|nr:hypothetical protein [Planctomycetota bacterium]